MDKRQVKHQRVNRRDLQNVSYTDKSKAPKSRNIIIILAFSFLAATSILLIAQLRVKKVQVDGTTFSMQVENTARDALSKQLFGSNLLLLRSRGVKADVLYENGDQVTGLKIQKDYFNRTLKIIAVDREPSIQWQSNGKLFEVDQTGRITKEVQSRNKLPLVVDESNVQIQPHTQVTTLKFLNFIHRIQKDFMSNTSLTPQKYRIQSTTKEVRVDTNSNFFILFDTDADPNEQIDSVKRVLEVAKSKNQLPTSYIDVRIAYKAYYK